MRRALYGGSFDPIHAGHVEPILKAREELGLDEVVYLPTARPPHKPGRELAGAHHRFAMAELALLDHPELVVSPFELTPESAAFTIDSVHHFRALHPEDDLLLLIGGDSLARFDTWRRWEEILEAARLAVLARPGWSLETVSPGLPAALAARVDAGEVDLVENPLVDASSTRIRELLAGGDELPAGWVADRVLQYLRKYSIYR